MPSINQMTSWIKWLNPNFILLRDVYFSLSVLLTAYKLLDAIRALGFRGCYQTLVYRLQQSFYNLASQVPSIRKQIETECQKTEKELKESLNYFKEEEYFTSLQDEGISENLLITKLEDLYKSGNFDWEGGKVSGTVYELSTELDKIYSTVMRLYSLSNPLHIQVFPGVNKMEKEVIRMVVDLYCPNGYDKFIARDSSFSNTIFSTDPCGSFTSGGTESILLTCKAHRDWFYEHRTITHPEIVLSETAHAAFDKAGEYFGIKIVRVPLEKDYSLSNKRLESYVNKNTIMIVGSTPNYPHGICDDMQGLSQISLKYGIGLHMDACLGGFIVPFTDDYSISLYNFGILGITSISCDTHKYGLTIKGSSVVMYRNKLLRRKQYSLAEKWLGGIYATPTISGSKPGLLIAATWAALLKRGKIQYKENAKKLIECARMIKEGIGKIKELEVIGDPKLSVVAFKSRNSSCPLEDNHELPIMSLAQSLDEKGWDINKLQSPLSLHITVTLRTVHIGSQIFLEDLQDSINEVKSDYQDYKNGKIEKKKFNNSTLPIYSSRAALDHTGITTKFVEKYLDSTLDI